MDQQVECALPVVSERIQPDFVAVSSHEVAPAVAALEVAAHRSAMGACSLSSQGSHVARSDGTCSSRTNEAVVLTRSAV